MQSPSGCLRCAVGLLCSWLVAGGSAPASQPADGVLRLTVADPSGAVVVGARVTVSGPGRQEGVRRDGVSGPAGDLVLGGLAHGTYLVVVDAEGFEPATLADVPVGAGETSRRVTLAIARRLEAVEVTRDRRDAHADPRGDGFTLVLGPEQIAALPDDPEGLEQAIRHLAGPGAVIRVDGFRGGRLPPKHRIERIRFGRNLFAADRHEPGVVAADIVTRPGLGQWQGSLDLGGRSGALAARNAYATSARAERLVRVAMDLDGPLSRGRTSVSFAVEGRWASEAQPVRAALPSGLFTGVVPRPTGETGFTGRLHQALASGHAVWIEAQHTRKHGDGLGVGGHDLPERAYARTDLTRLVRLAERGPLGGRAYGEFRLEAGWQEWAEASRRRSPTIDVADAFTAGGAQREGGHRAREVELAGDVDVAVGGRHLLRIGFLLEGGRYRTDVRRNEAGTWTFASLAALAAASPATYTQRLGDPRVAFSVLRLGHYVQDDVRVGSGMTLSLGIRHELQTHVDDKGAVSPRAGLTWSPSASGRTTVRGGVGVFHTWLGTDVLAQLVQVDGRQQHDLVVEAPSYPDPWMGGVALAVPPSRYAMADDLGLPRLVQASAGLEHQIVPSVVASATYVRVQGSRQFRGRNVNAPDATGRRPDPESGRVVRIESTARSAGHLMNLGLSYNAPARRVFLTATYSLGSRRSEADGAFDLPTDPGDFAADWGPSASDVRHQFTAFAAASLGHGLRAGLQVRANSASPYNITTGLDDNDDGVFNDRPPGVGRNAGRGDGMFDVGLRLGWNRAFGRRARAPRMLEVYVSVTNATNAVNRTGYSGVITSPFFGQASAARPARRVELGTRLGF